jgi:hypothetical protein
LPTCASPLVIVIILVIFFYSTRIAAAGEIIVLPPSGGEHYLEPGAGVALLRLGIDRLVLRGGRVLYQAVDIPGLVHGVDLFLPDMVDLPGRRFRFATAASQQHYQEYRVSHHRLHFRVLKIPVAVFL